MKKVNYFLLLGLLSIFIFGVVDAKNNRHIKVKHNKYAKVKDVVSPYKIWRTNTAPVIDGKMDKIWCSIPWIPITHYTIVGNATPDSEDNAGLTKAMWDDNNLYLLFYNEAPNIYDNTTNQVWNQTAVEVYIGATDSKAPAYTATDYQLAFSHWMQGQEASSLGSIDEAGGMPTAGVQFAISTDYSYATDSTAGLGGWWLELKIPLSNLNIPPVGGTIIGWDLQQDIVEDPTATARQYISYWWDTTNNNWKETDTWGEAILSPDVNIGMAKIFYTKQAPTIDGIKDDVYSASKDQSADYWRFVDGTLDDCPNPTASNVVASALWDDNNLYLFFDVNDNNITDLPENVNWNQSDVCFYLGPDDKANPYSALDQIYQIPNWMKGKEAGKLTSIFGGKIDTTGCVFKIADRGDGTGYGVEVQIPWANLNLGLPINSGTKIGYLFEMDYSSNGTARTGVAQWWDNTNGNWNDASIWGEAVLENGGNIVLPPSINTTVATTVTSITAVLNAKVNPNGSATTAYFEWGTNNTLSSPTTTEAQSIGSGTSNQTITANLTGLNPNTTYYYRAVAQNSSGTQRGTIVSFLTLPTTVTLSTPSDGAVNQLLTLKLTWKQYTGATKYHLQLSTDQGFNSLIIDNSAITNVSTEIGPLTFETTYYWHVSAINDVGESRYSAASKFKTIPVPPTTIAMNKTYTYPQKQNVSDYTKEDFKIIGLPGSSNQDITKFLQGSEKSDWEAYWDDGGTDNYDIKYNGSSNFILTAGKAFWVISKNNINVNATIQAAAMNTNYEVEIPLHSGWNLITNPYAASIPWARVDSANGITTVIHQYNGGSYSQSSSFDPYIGYYFFNGTPNTTLSTLRVPYQSIYANVVSTESLTKNDWRVNVQLQSAGIVDKSLSFGVSSAASAGLNKYNFRKPRALAGVPEIHFNRTDWDSDFPAFAADIRPSIGEVERWQLSVNGKQGASAKLVFGGINEVPASCAVFIVDSLHATFADLRKDSVYEFIQPTNSTSMTILVGSPEKVEKEAQSVLPVSYELSRNFPNPFNPSTNFLVRLPAASPACRTGRQVTVRVYNILGQMVREIYHGNLDVGQHWFTWDGRNQNQQKMPSGVYYCRLEVSGKLSQSIKMVLIN